METVVVGCDVRNMSMAASSPISIELDDGDCPQESFYAINRERPGKRNRPGHRTLLDTFQEYLEVLAAHYFVPQLAAEADNFVHR